jgi:hypothetical protein
MRVTINRLWEHGKKEMPRIHGKQPVNGNMNAVQVNRKYSMSRENKNHKGNEQPFNLKRARFRAKLTS